ncbi:MAG: hypothetical protein ACMUHY_08290 [Thermoplasmatota archaeon]
MCIPVFRKDPGENPIQHTAKIIAFALILLFAAGLVGTGVIAALRDNTEWFSLFKEGFLILSGAIATVIGYYFGSRSSEAAQSELTLEKESKQAVIEAKESIMKDLEDIASTSDPIIPMEAPMIDTREPETIGIMVPKKKKKKGGSQ